MPEIMIFKSGKYPQGDWPKERVQKMVDAYDPEKSIEAPVVIGHRDFRGNRWPIDNDEAQYAHGWITSLRMDGSGKVYADIPEFTDDVKKALAEKKLRYVSAEIYEFDKVDPAEPPYLKAIALLGRDTPAIPTTRLPSLFSLMRGELIESIDEENHISTFTRKVKDFDFEEEDVGELEDLKARLAKADAAVATYKNENADLKAAAQKRDAEQFYGKLRDDGVLFPAVFDKAVALDGKLSTDQRAELRTLFGTLGKKVEMSNEHIAHKTVTQKTNDAPIASRIRAFQKERNIATFAEAAEVLYNERPELFEEGK